MTGHYPQNPQYPGVSEEKTFSQQHNAWIRKDDCAIAERFFGYRWLPFNGKTDFHGNKFYAVLTPPNYELDAAYILEPDTRVPNFTTKLHYALAIARAAKIASIPVLETDRATMRWICTTALMRPLQSD